MNRFDAIDVDLEIHSDDSVLSDAEVLSDEGWAPQGASGSETESDDPEDYAPTDNPDIETEPDEAPVAGTGIRVDESQSQKQEQIQQQEQPQKQEQSQHKEQKD